MDTDLKATCPECKLRDQHCGMPCGFCGHDVPMPAGSVNPDGTAARVEEIIGYRGWRITRAEDGTPRLSSPLFDAVWEPGEWMIATCQGRSGSTEDHGPADGIRAKELVSPVKGCGGEHAHGCGFYAGRTRDHLIKLGYGRYTEADPHVIGQVQMAGKIIFATNGFRAEKVRPRTIYVPFEMWKLAAELKAVYGPHGVEVECKATLVPDAGARQWCDKCGGRMPRSTKCPTCGHTHT